MAELDTLNDLDQTSEPGTLASRTYESIKSDIINGNLSQGTKIVESDLALKYGISRGPLREAIHRLEQIKLICTDFYIDLKTRFKQIIFFAKKPFQKPPFKSFKSVRSVFNPTLIVQVGFSKNFLSIRYCEN